MLQLQNIYKSYGKLHILEDISLRINKAEIVSITGASGAGKSTLLQIMGTLDRPDQGKIIINDIDVLSLTGSKLASFRNQEIGFVFQFHHLLAEFSALENVSMPALIAGDSKSVAEEKAYVLLKKLNMTERASHKPGQLSGGEQQRVAIGRALINNPSVVLADEPSGNLDSKNSDELMDYIFMLREEMQQTFVLVTHDAAIAARGDSILHVKDGRING